ncbi:RHS repeat domain-containing protein [Flavobacterium oreochromis]|uniref:RHS repeat domain-containing protein n=1 Tax=Flavobacterium oreochromis TaxID=2906078 RepID=UPI0035B151EA
MLYSWDGNVLLHEFDYKLGERPAQAYNEQGEIVWSAEYDIYGKITKLKGEKTFIPFRQLGQYEDPELDGLYYNRFRYYDASTVLYLSQDLIIPQDALEHTPIAQDNHNDEHIKTRTYRVKDRTTQKTDSGRPFKMSFKQQLLINIINL